MSKSISLKELRARRMPKTAELPNGRVVTLRYTIEAHRKVLAAETETNIARQDQMYLDAVALVAPEMSEGELNGLEIEEALALIAVAKGQHDLVVQSVESTMQATEGNGPGAEADLPPSPSHPSTTSEQS